MIRFRTLAGMAFAATAGYLFGRSESTSSERPADRLRGLWESRTPLGPPPPSPPPPQWPPPPSEGTEFDQARERETAERHRAAEELKEHPPQKGEAPPPKEKRKRVSKIKDPHEDVLVPPHLT